jgi:hypothetical protein
MTLPSSSGNSSTGPVPNTDQPAVHPWSPAFPVNDSLVLPPTLRVHRLIFECCGADFHPGNLSSEQDFLWGVSPSG